MRLSSKSVRARLLIGASAAVLALSSGAAAIAQDREPISISPQSLTTALQQFGSQTATQVMFTPALVAAKKTAGVAAVADEQLAMAQLLQGTGLTFRREGNTYLIESASDPQSGSAAGDGADGTVQALIVTAQKREENIQDVPIAMSAFTQEALERSQIAGGPDLMTQVPNMTFTKTNFTGYSIQLRGIGTQAISATTDPAVAVAFNNTPFIRNRFFEQEFYDLQRVEVLRGPQGTLYGRNATAGVVNLISQKPKFTYEAKASVDIANYNSSRLEGMVNVPLVEDKVALRLAGAWTKRDGYATNQITGNQIDGRDLWSTRLSLRFAPTDKLDFNLIWEHFQEDDDRLRSGKQLCNRHLPQTIGGVTVPYGETAPGSNNGELYETYFSQGCQAASLYSPDSFEAPVGLRLPYYRPLAGHWLPIPQQIFDPYASTSQSRDLRVIESTVDPTYRAKSDIGELQFSYDLTDHLTLTSETAYLADRIFSTQDYNRFSTAPGAFRPTQQLIDWGLLDEDGNFCDPQIGCANRVVAVDLSTADSRQFSQEFRLSSNFEGPFNFSFGGNFLRYDTEDKYYVFINTLTLAAAGRAIEWAGAPTPYQMGVTDNSSCLAQGQRAPDVNGFEDIGECVYIDPNPIGALNDQGHNYFLSRNPYKLISYAVFGEAYYKITEDLKLTAGLRWTVDKKQAPRIPSWTFAANSVGYPVAEVIDQEWREPTGRLALDWKPQLSFTDQTLLYASYAHGYKAGGANPPAAGLVMRIAGSGFPDFLLLAAQQAAVAPHTFDPEFVNAYEIGAKNTLLDGKLTLNLASFYYDYKGYQISQIVNRAAINMNFDAKVWGLELEANWRPVENLSLSFKGGYEKTRMADGSSAVDTMDRANGGQPDANGVSWYVTGPFPTFPSNCVLPVYTVVRPDGTIGVNGGPSGGNLGACEQAYVLGNDPMTGQTYTANPGDSNPPYTFPGYIGFDPHTAPNGGAGFSKDLSGHELPNAPHFTGTLSADYTIPLPNNWLATLHTDLYYQSEAWTRVFNTPGYDKLKAYTNVNLAAIFSNDDAGWKVMAYVKNVFDRDSITGAFLNSDDTGLTTNVFLTEPRLFGLRVTKDFSGSSWWTGANPNHVGPYPLTIELGGQVQRQTARFEPMRPSWMGTRLPEVRTPDSLQQRDLDTGDGRSVKVIYRPEGSRWNVSAAYRYGEANTQTGRFHADMQNVLEICGYTNPFYVTNVCAPGAPFHDTFPQFYTVYANYQSDTAVRSHEERGVADLAVGVDMGRLPGSISSELGLGLRYASFKSNASWVGDTLGDWNVPVGWLFDSSSPLGYQPTSNHRLSADLQAERAFKGAGPTVSWNAAAPLLGNEETGQVKLDWSLTGGVLFGEQKTSVTGQEKDILQQGHQSAAGFGGEFGLPQFGDPTITPVAIFRSRSQTVPLVDLSLGLSYDIQRIKVSTGYHWERYYNVLDAGFTERKEYDRTFDGPYFKIAVGFGG